MRLSFLLFRGSLPLFLTSALLANPTPPAPTSGPSGTAPEPKAAKKSPNWEYETREVLGWKLLIQKRLLIDQKEATETAVGLLKKQLEEIIRVVPAAAVTELKKVPLYFSPSYTKGGGAEYHPGADWLERNGRDPAMEKAVEFSNIPHFREEVDRMPNFTLHELAHAYHDRFLSFDQPDILRQFQIARDNRSYQVVERRLGGNRPNTREKAYAMTDHKEYFAEVTEAFFSENDFFPFRRDQLEKHDPGVVEVLKKVWK